MAFFSVLTIVGLQVYAPAIAENNFGVYLNRYSIQKVSTRRIGYAFFYDTRKAATGERFLLVRNPVYIPGIYIPMPHNFDILGAECQLEVNWDVAGIPINIYY